MSLLVLKRDPRRSLKTSGLFFKSKITPFPNFSGSKTLTGAWKGSVKKKVCLVWCIENLFFCKPSVYTLAWIKPKLAFRKLYRDSLWERKRCNHLKTLYLSLNNLLETSEIYFSLKNSFFRHNLSLERSLQQSFPD